MKNNQQYERYTLEDFVQDLDFRAWVAHNSPQHQAFWETWIAEHPEQRSTIERARSMVESLKIKEVQIDDTDVQRAMERIRNTIQQEELTPTSKTILHHNILRYRWLAAAALLCLLTAIWWWFGRSAQNITETAEVIAQTQENVQKITLPDSSTVILQPYSELRYQRAFTEQREVQLKGEGLFDVAHNPQKPFVVKGGQVVVTVLGTQFTVKAFDADRQTTVDVLRGKVAVSAQSEKDTDFAKTPAKQLILQPNQKAVFSKEDKKLEQTLIDQPIQFIAQDTIKQQVFEDTSVVTILDALEETYKVDLVYNTNALKNCIISTSLTDEPLFEKLRAICKTIGAQYRIVGVQVMIEGGYCE